MESPSKSQGGEGFFKQKQVEHVGSSSKTQVKHMGSTTETYTADKHLNSHLELACDSTCQSMPTPPFFQLASGACMAVSHDIIRAQHESLLTARQWASGELKAPNVQKGFGVFESKTVKGVVPSPF
ncbi:hypothetical protein ACOSQ2_014498 [Xanthoceras sorbifolium]